METMASFWLSLEDCTAPELDADAAPGLLEVDGTKVEGLF